MKYSFLLAAILLCSAVTVHSQAPTGETPIRLSQEEAVEQAIKNNLMLETARIGMNIQKRKATHAWNQFLPNAMVTGTMTRSNWTNTVTGMAPVTSLPLNPFLGLPPGTPDIYGIVPYSMDLPRWNVVGMFSANLDFSFALIESIRSSQLEYRAGLLTYEKVKIQIEQNVRKMYNQILLLEANAALLNDSYNNAVRQAAIAEASFRAGLAPRLTWLQAQVAKENMRPMINDLTNNIKNLKGIFALILGLPHDTDFILDPVSPESFFIPEDLSLFISKSAAMQKPDILELQANIKTLQSQRNALRLQHFTPFIRLGWDIGSMFDPTLDPFSNNWFTRDHWTTSQAGGSFSLTVGMSLNGIFGFTREGQQRKDMEAGIKIQNIILSQMIQETEQEIFTKINSLEMIRSTVTAQQAAVELAETAYRLTLEAYRAGLQDFQSVQNSSLALDQARLQLLTFHFNFMNDLIDLEYAIGVPFGTLGSNGH